MLQIERAGNAEADGRDVVGHQLVHRELELADERILGLGRTRTLVTAQHFAVLRHDTGEDFRPAEVDSDGMTGAHGQRVP